MNWRSNIVQNTSKEQNENSADEMSSSLTLSGGKHYRMSKIITAIR